MPTPLVYQVMDITAVLYLEDAFSDDQSKTHLRGHFGARGVGQRQQPGIGTGSEVCETETPFILGHLLSSQNEPGLVTLNARIN